MFSEDEASLVAFAVLGREDEHASSSVDGAERINLLTILEKHTTNVKALQFLVHRFPSHLAGESFDQCTSFGVEFHVELRGEPVYLVVAHRNLSGDDLAHVVLG